MARKNRCEEFEKMETSANTTVDLTKPLIIKLSINKPERFKNYMMHTYDDRYLKAVAETAEHLVRTTGATFAYYSALGIVLVLIPSDNAQQNNRISSSVQRIISKISSSAAAYMGSYMFRTGFFDENIEDICVPNMESVVFNVNNLTMVSKYVGYYVDFSRADYVNNMFRKLTGKTISGINTKTMLATLEVLGHNIYENANEIAYEGKFVYRKRKNDFVSYEESGTKYLYLQLPANDFIHTPNNEKSKFIVKLVA